MEEKSKTEIVIYYPSISSINNFWHEYSLKKF